MARTTKKSKPHPYTDDARGPRLQKVMAEAGVASRRECEALIEAGRVTVNGERLTALPAWVSPSEDRIEVDGQPIRRTKKPGGSRSSSHNKRAAHQHIYIALNKPRNVISTTNDPDGRRDVLAMLPDEVTNKHRLYPVGRLDADSTGLILLTNDGDLAHRLTHPSFGVAKRYRVSVRGRLTQDDAHKLQDGLHLADRKRRTGARKVRMSEVKLLGSQRDDSSGDRTDLSITLHEGQNREVRRMIAQLGHKVRRLERVAIGPISIKGLARGGWRMLTGVEITRLRRAAGLDGTNDR
ncbi:MAG: pseudouridine synthase [Phycisphaera sp.]|nr:pseudouridine synthase [Phycisphaera sp.]